MSVSNAVNEQVSSSRKPDFQFWARMPGWRVREQAALFLGLDPDDWDKCKGDADYAKLKRILNRALAMREITSPATPRRSLEWAKSNGISYPPELADAVRCRRKLRDWRRVAAKLRRESKELLDGDEINPRGRRTVYQIILTAALDHYGFKVDGNNDAAEKLAKAVGNRMKSAPRPDTVRRWLSEAEKVLKESLNK